MRSKIVRCIASAAAVLSIACGSDETHDGADDAGSGGHATGHGGSGGGSGATGGLAGNGGGEGGEGGNGGTFGGGSPQAPAMEGAMPMDGALHVTWTNVTPDCDAIELDRSKDGGTWLTAYTLTGVAEEHHDTEAVAPGTYCYVARCVKGAETSADSNEVCGTP